MSTYIRKPVKVEAFKWTGGPDQTEDPDWIVDRIKEGSIEIGPAGKGYLQVAEGEIVLLFKYKDYKGFPMCKVGEWIVKGGDDILTVVSEEVFLEMYDKEPEDGQFYKVVRE